MLSRLFWKIVDRLGIEVCSFFKGAGIRESIYSSANQRSLGFVSWEPLQGRARIRERRTGRGDSKAMLSPDPSGLCCLACVPWMAPLGQPALFLGISQSRSPAASADGGPCTAPVCSSIPALAALAPGLCLEVAALLPPVLLIPSFCLWRMDSQIPSLYCRLGPAQPWPAPFFYGGRKRRKNQLTTSTVDSGFDSVNTHCAAKWKTKHAA